MAPPDQSGRDQDLGDVYELLGVEEDAGDKDVQGAFRKGSLKCHPDRNPDDPEAAEKFDRLSRAKELLLDAARRAEYDRKRKAKRELQERFAQEDEKRRKLREKLESSEAAAAAGVADASAVSAAAEARKRYMKADLASRMRAKEAELAERHAGVAAEVAAATAKARTEAEESLVRVRWRDAKSAVGAAERAETIKKALEDFDVRAITLDGELEAVAQLGSREDALRAVLHCRERRHQLGFRVSIEDTAKQRAKAPAAPAPWEAGPAGNAAAPAPKRPRAATEAPAPSGGTAPAGGFDDWEAKMLADLQGLAAAQQKSRPAAAT